MPHSGLELRTDDLLGWAVVGTSALEGVRLARVSKAASPSAGMATGMAMAMATEAAVMEQRRELALEAEASKEVKSAVVARFFS